MKSHFSNRKGNALLIVLVVGLVGLGALGLFLANVGQYVNQVNQSGNAVSGSESDSKILGLVLKKVALNGKQKSDWFTGYYPTADEMSADKNANLATSNLLISSMSPAASSSDTFVRLYWVRGKIDENNQCKPISPFVYKKTKESGDCDAVAYVADGSGLGAVKSYTQDSGVNSSQAAGTLIGVPNLALLTIQDRLKLFSPGAKLPLATVVESVPVTFKKRIADSSNPNKLSKFLVSVNKNGKETLGLIPVPAPATPACQINLTSTSPVPLKLGSQNVTFNVKTDSVTSNLKITLPDGTQRNFNQFSRYSMSTYGEFRDLNSSGFVFDVDQSKGTSMIGQLGVTVDPTNQNRQTWNIIAEVAGLDGVSTVCNTSIVVDYPLQPLCNVYAQPSNPVPGESVNIVADCNSPLGGPVSDLSLAVSSEPSAFSSFKRVVTKNVEKIKTFNGQSVRVTETVFEDAPAASADKVKTFKTNYTKQTSRSEKLSVGVKSLTGVVQKYDIILGSTPGCPFNDPAYEALLFADKSIFKDADGTELDTIGFAPDDLIYTMGYKQYTRQNVSGYQSQSQLVNGRQTTVQVPITYSATLTSGPASLVGFGADFTRAYATGSWGFLIRDSDELCSPGHYCMVVKRTSAAGGHDGVQLAGYGKLDETNTYSNIQYYWVEVGLSMAEGVNYNTTMAADPNAVKRDPSCRVLNTKRSMFRVGGCFAGSTQVRMADGTDKKVSDVQADDWVLNPIYNSPVKVKKVVKGPEKKALWEVKYGENRVVVTEDHPFLTQQGWVQTQGLKAGEVLIGDGKSEKITSVKKLKYQAPEDVWNFELDTDDTYGHMVLANGVPTGDLTTQLNLKSQMKKIQ